MTTPLKVLKVPPRVTSRVTPPPTSVQESRGPGKEPTVTELGGPKDTLVVALPSEPDTMISVVMQQVVDSDIMGNLNLEAVDSTFDCKLEFSPEMYESSTWSPDHLVLTRKIRSDATWSDGQPITSKDVLCTYDLIADPKVSSPRIAYIEKMEEGKRPLIVDDHTVEFHFKSVYDEESMEAHASMELVPEHSLGTADRKSTRLNSSHRT